MFISTKIIYTWAKDTQLQSLKTLNTIHIKYSALYHKQLYDIMF